MKITVNINLGGYAFHLDEDAYQLLRRYLIRLGKEFSDEEGTAEIIADIENRMAEHFRMRLTKFKQVITLSDLEEVMAILGSPEAISGNGVTGSGSRRSSTGRFYRDPDVRLLGGVCSGIAAYFGWDPLIIRILFVVMVFAGGFGLALYLVLWMVLPEANATSQKVEMRGDPVTIENIKKMARQQLDSVKKKINL
jgi:phage shock protein PspC (stress-responsive transcriptional regulator)